MVDNRDDEQLDAFVQAVEQEIDRLDSLVHLLSPRDREELREILGTDMLSLPPSPTDSGRLKLMVRTINRGEAAGVLIPNLKIGVLLGQRADESELFKVRRIPGHPGGTHYGGGGIWNYVPHTSLPTPATEQWYRWHNNKWELAEKPEGELVWISEDIARRRGPPLQRDDDAALGQAAVVLNDSKRRARLCAALGAGADMARDVLKQLIAVAIPTGAIASAAGATVQVVGVTLGVVPLAILSIIIARMGVAAVCPDAEK